MSKYNPKFINNYFISLNSLFINITQKDANKLYKEYLKDEENNFDKYFNGLLYCLNYTQCVLEIKYPNSIKNFYDKKYGDYYSYKKSVINSCIEWYNKCKLTKKEIIFIITCYNKVNEFYNDIINLETKR